jgi:hypothetical protein
MSKLLTKFKRNAIDEIINSLDNKKVSGATITTPGSGYSNTSNNDAKTIVSTLGGTTFRVTANNTGNATTVSLLSAGVYNSNVAANNVATINTTGNGTGLTVNVSFTDENSYYVFVGGQSEYPTSDTPLEVDSTKTTYTTWNELMFGKKANFIRMTDKYVWTSNTVYTQYDDTVDLSDENFFVVTSTRDVFKCIYNNNGAPSTNEPTKRALRIGVPVEESDGYEWLYLYTIDKSDYTKFVTASYMPVVANTLIANAAIDGSIFNIVVEDGGEDYPYHSGNVLFSNTSTIKLETGANSAINYYKDSSIAVINTVTGNTYVRKILSSNSTLFVTTESFPNSFLSNTDCEYVIGPTVSVTSNTGSGIVAYSVVDTGVVDKIQIIDYGTGYKDAAVSITAGSGLGTGALGRVIISPLGGHGSDVYDELHVDSLGVHCLFDEWGTGNTFNADVTYRTVGLLKNPTDANETPYTSNTFNELATINISSIGVTGTFTYGELVKGTSSNNFGRFAYANSSVVLLTGTNGTFVIDEELVGAESLARRTVNANSTAVDLKLYSGEILYVQNIQEVTRSVSNKEQVKLVISF